MSSSSAAAAFPPEPEPEFTPAVYVHFMSGEVATLRPATDVLVQQDVVIVYNGRQPLASYPRKNVFSCSKTEVSPTLS